MGADFSSQAECIRSFWLAVLSGITQIYSVVHSSLLLQLIFLVSLIECGVVIVKFLKKEDDSEK